MPQGCDFTCRTPGCPGFEKTIVMHGVWPTKRIDEAIAEVDDPEHKAVLEARKERGRKTSLFVYPRDKNRPPCGYRLQLYCPKCLVVEDMDCGRDKRTASAAADDPPDCPTCGGPRLSLKKAIESGIQCPLCKQALKPFHWFTK